LPEISELFAQLGIVGQSPALQAVFRQALRAAYLSDVPALIVGPSGTGKRRLAEAIRALDPRRSGRACLTVHCAAIGKTLLESELFAEEPRRAASRSGLLRRANGGTLLFDKVTELDPALQPRLLRVLNEQQFLPIGEALEHPAGVRIIALADTYLDPLVARGCFLRELCDKLSAIHIRIPPLRERPEDIAHQARHFLRLHQRTTDRRVLDFELGVLEALKCLPWEGNTRQLENLVRETLARKHRGTMIKREDLPQRVREALGQLPSPIPNPGQDANDPVEKLLRKACEQRWTLRQAMKEIDQLLPFRPTS
jgi:DNA-binding NtrC family response regulator